MSFNFLSSCNDNPHINQATIKIRPHSKQISIKGLILAVPFKVKGNSIFQKVDVVSVNVATYRFNLKRFVRKSSPTLCGFSWIFLHLKVATYSYFTPTQRIEEIVELLWYRRLISPSLEYILNRDAQSTETVLYFIPFLWKGIMKNFQCMSIIVKTQICHRALDE